MYIWDQARAIIKALDERDDLNVDNVEDAVDAAIASVTDDPARAEFLRLLMKELHVL